MSKAKRQRDRLKARLRRESSAEINHTKTVNQLWRRPGYRQVEPTSSELCIGLNYDQLGRRMRRRRNPQER